MGGRNEQAQNRQNRRIAVVTTQRHEGSFTPVVCQYEDPPANTAANNECDLNADTASVRTLLFSRRHTVRSMLCVRLVNQADYKRHYSNWSDGYDDPFSGDTFILVFNEALYYGTQLNHSLINPNQVRAYGIPLWDNPNDPARDLTIEVDNSLRIPLQPVGTKLQFRTRVSTTQELRDCEHIQMTSLRPWNPTNIVMVQGMTQGGSTETWKRWLSL